jgi:hypothetical protein
LGMGGDKGHLQLIAEDTMPPAPERKRGVQTAPPHPFLLLFVVVLGIELRASRVLGKH